MKKLERPSSKSVPPPDSSPPKSEKERILYVEDEDENWTVAELFLKRSYEVIRARTDREACAAVLEYGKALSAILMDIQLQGSILDGVKLVRLFRGKLSHSDRPAFAQQVPALNVPILFVTAYGARYSEAELRAAGADRMIKKPIDFMHLNTLLAHLRIQRENTAKA